MIESSLPYIRVRSKSNIYRFLPCKRYTADEISSLRKSCKLIQKELAEMMGVSTKTVESWEQGINTPGSSAARLLDLLSYDSGYMSFFEDIPCDFTAEEIRNLRGKYNLSRELFALALGVSESSLENWETKRTIPNGPARRLLELVSKGVDILELFMEKEA